MEIIYVEINAHIKSLTIHFYILLTSYINFGINFHFDFSNIGLESIWFIQIININLIHKHKNSYH